MHFTNIIFGRRQKNPLFKLSNCAVGVGGGGEQGGSSKDKDNAEHVGWDSLLLSILRHHFPAWNGDLHPLLSPSTAKANHDDAKQVPLVYLFCIVYTEFS